MSGDFRKQKMQERIQQIINTFVKSLSDPRLQFMTVTKVQLSNDFSRAKVYWDTYDAEKKQDISQSLKRVRGKVRTQISNGLRIRQAPELDFIYDTQFEDESKITQLLKKEKDSGKY